MSCKLTLGKYIWLSYYRLLPGSHSLFIRMMCLNPCPALFSCWKLFWAQQENLLILDCYRMGLFSCPCILCWNFRRLKVSIIIYIVPHFLVYSYTDRCICVKQTIIFTLFQITVNNIHHVHCTFRTDWLYLLVWTVLSHQNSQVWTWSCLSLPFMWSLFSWSKVNFK